MISLYPREGIRLSGIARARDYVVNYCCKGSKFMGDSRVEGLTTLCVIVPGTLWYMVCAHVMCRTGTSV